MRSGGKPVTPGRRRSTGGRRGGSLTARVRAALLLLSAPLLLLAVSLLFRHETGSAAPYRRLTGSREQRKHSAPYVGPVKEDAFGMLGDISYLGVREVDDKLGCPSTHGCFYSFSEDGEPLGEIPASARAKPTDICHRVLSNCNKHGECIKNRDWCLLRGRKPSWLHQHYPGTWAEEERPTYLFGRSEGNPTHVACLHMLPLLRWITAANITLGQVLMIWDQPRIDGPGLYGEGLAAPMGRMKWLSELGGPITFRNLHFGEYGDLRFPYHLLKHELGLAVDPVFQHLANLSKASVGVPVELTAPRPKVVIVQRQHTRVLIDAVEIQQQLNAEGIEASVVDFSVMTFAQQVTAVHDAAALISVHGADCMNLMFLPPRGVMLEISPTHYGYGPRKIMRKGDYFNLAQLLGKTHLDYVSPLNATILRTPDGGLSDWNHVNFVGDVQVELKEFVPLVKAAVMSACGDCYQACGPVNAKGEVQCARANGADKLAKAGLIN